MGRWGGRSAARQPVVVHRRADRQTELSREHAQALPGQFKQAESGQIGWGHRLGWHDAQEATSNQAEPTVAHPADIATEHVSEDGGGQEG